MAIETHILDANRKLLAHQELLTAILPEVAMKAAGLLNADGINISVSPFKQADAPESGIGGFSFSPYRLELLLDSDREDLDEIIRKELPAVLGHEMHHCVRSHYCAEPVTFWEYITIEGLATHFEIQMNGGIQPSLFNNFPEVDWRELLETVRPLRNEKAFSFRDWFLGGDPEQVPKYAGYFIGFQAMSHFQRKRNYSDLDMIRVTADELYECL